MLSKEWRWRWRTFVSSTEDQITVPFLPDSILLLTHLMEQVKSILVLFGLAFTPGDSCFLTSGKIGRMIVAEIVFAYEEYGHVTNKTLLLYGYDGFDCYIELFECLKRAWLRRRKRLSTAANTVGRLPS